MTQEELAQQWLANFQVWMYCPVHTTEPTWYITGQPRRCFKCHPARHSLWQWLWDWWLHVSE